MVAKVSECNILTKNVFVSGQPCDLSPVFRTPIRKITQ